MKVISGNSKLLFKKTAVAIGIFDGVHRGHQYLIQQMLATARRLHATPVVITFFPHPAHVLRPDVKLPYLISLDDRFELLNQLGIKACVVIPFNRSFAKIEPQKFIQDVLVKQLHVKAVFVGEDFMFGRNRSGDISLFEKLGQEHGYEAHGVKALKRGKNAISSTRIRALITEGKLKEASNLLGHPVFTSGKVIRGAQRGRTLGFPTANVDYQSDIIPPKGVYIVKVWLGKKAYNGMANIGTRPTFDKKSDSHLFMLEVHLLDFSQNLYNKLIKVEFLKKIRNEKKFSSPQQLIVQIKKDEVKARHYLA